MKETPNLPFLARSGYRRRRLIEAVRLMPIVGILLFLLPILWTGEDQIAQTSGGWLYIFGAWFFLIGIAAIASRSVARNETSEQDPGSKSDDI